MQPNGLCRNPSIAPNAPIYAVGLLDADYGSLIKVIRREHPSEIGREKAGRIAYAPLLRESELCQRSRWKEGITAPHDLTDFLDFESDSAVSN